MADKSGGDIMQNNTGAQGNMSSQDLTSMGVGGAGAVDAMGGTGAGMGVADQTTTQALDQANAAVSGIGGSDNINANTTINIS